MTIALEGQRRIGHEAGWTTIGVVVVTEGRTRLGAARCAAVGSTWPRGYALPREIRRFPGTAAAPAGEDALLAIDAGQRALLAVADAHYGTFASHALLRGLAATLREVPASPMDLGRAVRSSALEGPIPQGDSASTLLLVVLRRDMGAGFGFSWVDSTCASVGGSHDGRALCQPNEGSVNPALPWTLGAERAWFFEFDLPVGGLVLAFTDGIDECHYRRKKTSLGPAQFVALVREVGAEPEVYAGRLAQWALDGVNGRPGGQDNLVVAGA